MALEPSICSNMAASQSCPSSRAFSAGEGKGRLRGFDIGFADLARKCAADRLENAVDRDDADTGRERAEESGVGRRAADMLEREFGRRHSDDMAARRLRDDLV